MLEIIQKDVTIYYNIIYLCKIIIQAYKDYLTLIINLIKSLVDISSFINDCYTSIINFKAIYKLIEERYLDKYKDNKLYPTNC